MISDTAYKLVDLVSPSHCRASPWFVHINHNFWSENTIKQVVFCIYFWVILFFILETISSKSNHFQCFVISILTVKRKNDSYWIFSFLTLIRKSNNTRFLFFNTHLWTENPMTKTYTITVSFVLSLFNCQSKIK